MRSKLSLAGAVCLVLGSMAVLVGAQGPPPAGGRGAGGQGAAPAPGRQGGNPGATFPAQQRPPGDPGAHRPRERAVRRSLPRVPRRGPARRRHRRTESPPLAARAERSGGRADRPGHHERPTDARHAGDAAAGAPAGRPQGDCRVHPQRPGDDARAGVAAGGPRPAAEHPRRRRRRRPGVLQGELQHLPFADRRPAGHRRAACRSHPAPEPLGGRRARPRRGRRRRAWCAEPAPGHRRRDATERPEGRRPAGQDRRLPGDPRRRPRACSARSAGRATSRRSRCATRSRDIAGCSASTPIGTFTT